MTIFYDLFLFIKDTIYVDLTNAFDLFPFLQIKLIDTITLSQLLSTVATLSIVFVCIWFLVSLFLIPIKLLKGAIK